MFSAAELQLACNQEIILTKNRIIDKVYDEFGLLGKALFDEFEGVRKFFPEEMGVLPKISKGEQYRCMPWVMLDYPRWFNRQKGHLALRVMFWWGNYFLVQLHVSGIYLPLVYSKSAEWFWPDLKVETGWKVGFPQDPWNFLIPQEGLHEAGIFSWDKEITENYPKEDGQQIFKIAKTIPFDSRELEQTVMKLARFLKMALQQ